LKLKPLFLFNWKNLDVVKRNRLANVILSCKAIGYFFFRLLNEAKPKKVFRLLQRLEGKLEIEYNRCYTIRPTNEVEWGGRGGVADEAYDAGRTFQANTVSFQFKESRDTLNY
jgi:hypothetical protein